MRGMNSAIARYASRGGEFVMGVVHLDVGRPSADDRRLGLRESGHGRTEDTQKAERAVVAHRRLQREPGGQPVDVSLAERELVRAGDGQAEQCPGMRDVVDRYAERRRRRSRRL